MPSYSCHVCGKDFVVAPAVLAKYPGWTPRACRAHRGGRRGPRGAARAEIATGVFTDGSASPNPGPGGYGVVWVEDGRIVAERRGRSAATTNNRMELTALLAAYEMLPEDASVTVHSDSRLCVDTITKWAPAWERKEWRRAGGPIQNLDLVKPLLAAYRAHPLCPLAWIEAHAGHEWNEHADRLATSWMREEA